MARVERDHRAEALEGGERLLLLCIATVAVLVFGGLAAGSARAAVVGTGAVAGAVALAVVLTFAAGRTADVLFLGLAFLVAVPVDKYFDYQAHVGGWPGIRLSAADLLLVLLLPLAIASRALGRSSAGLSAALVGLVALGVAQYGLSLVGSQRPDLSLFEIAATLHAVAVAWVVAVLFRRRHAPGVVAALAVQVWLHTAFALAQAVTKRPIGAGVFGGRAEVMTEALTTGTDLVRPSGLFVHPIVYADFLFLALPVIAAGALVAPRTWQRAALGATVLFGIGGLALTLSRGAWAASLVAAATFVALGLRRRLLDPARLRTLAKVAAAAGIVLAIAFGPRVYERLTESQEGNVDVRFELNWVALRMIADRPLLGQGLNTFVESMAPYDPRGVMSYFPAPAHNLYLLEAAEAGLPALAILLATFAAILVAGVRGVARTADPMLAWLAIAVVSGLAGLLVSQLADFSLRLEPLRTTVWFLVGLLFGALHAGARHGADGPHRDLRPAVAPAAMEDLA